MRIKILLEQRSHTVKKGENLSSIAKKHGVDWRELARINKIEGPKYVIRPGEEIFFDEDTDIEFEKEIEELAQEIFMEKVGDSEKISILAMGLATQVQQSEKSRKTAETNFIKSWDHFLTRVYELFKEEIGKIASEEGLTEKKFRGLAVSVVWNFLIMKKGMGPQHAPEYLLDRVGAERHHLALVGGNFSNNFPNHCLNIHTKAKKHYGRMKAEAEKRVAAASPGKDLEESQKIFEEYFKKNNKILEQDEESSEEITSMVVAAVNDILNALPDDAAAKNRETGLKMMAAIRRELQNPERLASVVDDIADELSSEI